MRMLGYIRFCWVACCVAVMGLATPAHAIERSASLPYVYEVNKTFPTCDWAGAKQVLTTTATGSLQCVTVPTGTATKIPACSLTQYLGVDAAGALTCKTLSAVCASGQVLQKIDNDTFGCTSLPTQVVTAAPQCGALEVLQGDGDKTFRCVNIGNLALPKCNAGSVITNLGGAVQCVDTVAAHFPNDCGAGQALTVENGKFQCTTFSTGTACAAGTMALLNKGITYCVATSCAENERLTFVAGKPVCKDLPSNRVIGCSGSTLSDFNTVFEDPLLRGFGGYTLTASEMDRMRNFTFPSGSLAYIPTTDGTVATHTFNTSTRRGVVTNIVPLILKRSSSSNTGMSVTACTSNIQCTGPTGWQPYNTMCTTSTPDGGGPGNGSDGMSGG